MVYLFDIDGVICDRRLDDYEKSKPNQKMIDQVNRLYDEGHKIILETGRGNNTGKHWELFTVIQLDEWGVNYHHITFNKPLYDVRIDDKSINVHNYKQIMHQPGLFGLKELVDKWNLTKWE